MVCGYTNPRIRSQCLLIKVRTELSSSLRLLPSSIKYGSTWTKRRDRTEPSKIPVPLNFQISALFYRTHITWPAHSGIWISKSGKYDCWNRSSLFVTPNHSDIGKRHPGSRARRWIYHKVGTGRVKCYACVTPAACSLLHVAGTSCCKVGTYTENPHTQVFTQRLSLLQQVYSCC